MVLYVSVHAGQALLFLICGEQEHHGRWAQWKRAAYLLVARKKKQEQ
jgi:hypothetical protein